jgi:hypothetical protein
MRAVLCLLVLSVALLTLDSMKGNVRIVVVLLCLFTIGAALKYPEWFRNGHPSLHSNGKMGRGFVLRDSLTGRQARQDRIAVVMDDPLPLATNVWRVFAADCDEGVVKVRPYEWRCARNDLPFQKLKVYAPLTHTGDSIVGRVVGMEGRTMRREAFLRAALGKHAFPRDMQDALEFPLMRPDHWKIVADDSSHFLRSVTRA